MKEKTVAYFVLEGSNQDIGRQLASKIKANSGFVKAPATFTDVELREAIELYNRYCPGLVEELESYAHAYNIPISDIAYTWMTYLIPRCSGLILNGSLMDDGNPRLIRNYEFDLEHEDMIVFETNPKGRYGHIGGSVALFGRSEGINECGLAISMSSCGLPVSNISEMRSPKIRGLQFWAVIRSLLENCKDMDEALVMVKEMPIAYNINLLIIDANGNGCIVETMDSEITSQTISSESKRKYLCATNHIAIRSFQNREPFAMHNSLVRLQNIERFMENKKTFNENDLCDFFISKYPIGLSTSYYSDFFGTVKTVIMDPIKRTFKIRWLVEAENGWEEYQIGTQTTDHTLKKYYINESADASFFKFIKL